MAEKDKKYYWLKLNRGFFKRHDMLIIEDMPNGKDYILFYLKLLCESVDHEGNLRFSEEIPYNEEMLSSLTHTNIDIVRSAVKLFTGLRMMTIMDDGTYYMNQVQKMIGSETYWAQKKREQRENQVLDVGHCPTLSNGSPMCPSKSIEKDTDKDIEKEGEGEEKGPEVSGPSTAASPLEKMGGRIGQNVLMLTDEQSEDLLDRLSLDEYDLYCKKLSDYIIAHPDKTFKSHYKTILKWVEEDRSVET